jgi:predicted MFS family arabinose efflux permease
MSPAGGSNHRTSPTEASGAAAARRPAGPGSGFEPWMISNFTTGAALGSFVVLLVPPYVASVTGNPGIAGLAIAVLTVAATAGPAIGGFADSYRCHRLVYTLSMLGIAVGFALFAIPPGIDALHAVNALVLGVAATGQGTLGPAFIVGARLPQQLEARQLTTYNLLYPVGQIAGGALMALAGALGYSERFWLSAGFCMVGFAVTVVTVRSPVERLHAVMYGAQTSSPAVQLESEGAPRHAPGVRQVLGSRFGVFLLIVALSWSTGVGITSQIANIMPNVFGYSSSATAALVSLAGIVSLVAILAAGRWMQRAGPMAAFSVGTAFRLVGAAGMAVLGMTGSLPLLAGGFAIVLMSLGRSITRLAQPALAFQFAPVRAGAALGFLFGAAALGGFVGSLIGGFASAAFGYNAVNWIGAGAGAAALAILIGRLLPAYRGAAKRPQGA